MPKIVIFVDDFYDVAHFWYTFRNAIFVKNFQDLDKLQNLEDFIIIIKYPNKLPYVIYQALLDLIPKAKAVIYAKDAEDAYKQYQNIISKLKKH